MTTDQAIAKLDEVARSLVAAYERVGVCAALVRPHGADDVRVMFPLGDVRETAELLCHALDVMAMHAGNAKQKRVQ